MFKLVFYVPATAKETVKQAIFQAGAGAIGDYEHCCWEVQGEGQFRPLLGAQPHIGQIDKLETVSEFRVEMVCNDDRIRAAVAALKSAHPYEEPAYDVWRLETF